MLLNVLTAALTTPSFIKEGEILAMGKIKTRPGEINQEETYEGIFEQCEGNFYSADYF